MAYALVSTVSFAIQDFSNNFDLYMSMMLTSLSFLGVTAMLLKCFRKTVLRDEEKMGLGNRILIVVCRGVPVSRQKDGGTQMLIWVIFLL